MSLDLDLSGHKEEIPNPKDKEKIPPFPFYPLKSMDIFCTKAHHRLVCAQQAQDLIQLRDFQKHYNWSTKAGIIKEFDYDALILTDFHQTIQWVNKGFTSMTGYPAKYAIGKKPAFLQGKNTDEDVKEYIRTQLFSKNPFTTSIINYRKNKQEYLCEISVFPLKNKAEEITHFLAVERELAKNK